MLATLFRWMRPVQAEQAVPVAAVHAPVPPAPEAPAAATVDPVELRARFLAVALGRETAFDTDQTAALLALLQEASDGDGFDALRLPRLPAVVPQLLQVLRDDRAGLAEAATLAARDPQLATGILRVANSAYYAGGETLDSLPLATVRLGRDTVRRIVLQIALRPIHPAAPGTPVHAAGERLWTHAQCCGIACSAAGHGFEGMLAGLAGATGASAVLGMVARTAPELLHAGAVHAVFSRAMWRIAARAARAWALPSAVVGALYEHADGNARAPLALGLAQAELLAMQYLLQRWNDPALPVALHAPDAAAAWAALKHHHPEG